MIIIAQTTVVLLNDCAGAAASDSVLVHYQCMGQNSLSFSKYLLMIPNSGNEVVDNHDTNIISCNEGSSLGYRERIIKVVQILFLTITKMQITEWRLINGQMQIIGSSQHDLMFHSFKISNSLPVLSGMNFDLKDGYSDLDTSS